MVSAHHNYESLREFDADVYVYLENHSERQVTPERPATVFTLGPAILLDTSDGSASAPVTFLPAFSTVVNATVATNGVSTPEGVAGVADPNWAARTSGSRPMAYPIKSWGRSWGFRQGVLTATLPIFFGPNPDTTNALYVNLAESGGALLSGTPIDAQNGITLCLVIMSSGL